MQNHVDIKDIICRIDIKYTICHFDDSKESLQNVGLAITNINPADFDAIGLGTLENVI
jgi:hypothetical protein